MIELSKYIIEKFKINSKTAKKGNVLVKLFNLDNDEADYLYQYWDPKEPLFKFNDPLCSPLESLLMLAFMLVDDNQDFNFYNELGYKDYKGKHNPYDYSWFEEEDEKGLDYLFVLEDWIKNNEDEFKKIYDIVKKHKDDFSEDKIFNDIQKELS